MTDMDIVSVFQPPRDMFWAPIQSDLTLYQIPGDGWDAIIRFVSSTDSHLVRLFRPVATFALIATQFPADRGSVDTNLI